MPHTDPRIAPPAGEAPAGADGSWNRLRKIIESLADGIVIVDHGGAIRFANPAAGRLFNRSPEQLVGTLLGSPLVAGETTEMEIVRRGGGEIVHAELRAVDTEWEGEPAELVSLRDVTDRKHAEERARQLAHEREARIYAESVSRTKSDFLAIMSHELRTPLNAILGYSELMDLGLTGEITPKMRDHIGRIRSSAKHLMGLVKDILDLAKVEAGRLTVAAEPANVSEAIASALTLVQPQAAVRNLGLSVVPGADDLPAYLGDDERVRQILVNLLSNAVKCTEPGGAISVEAAMASPDERPATLEARSAYLRITVRDTGSGIEAEKLEAIFEPFVQAESGTTRTREGSGLGLTIAMRLARAMSGDLTVDSVLGKGSAFHLWLPATPGEMVDVESERSEEPSDGGVRRVSRTADPTADLRGLCEVATLMLLEVQPLVDAIVSRIRSDPAIPTAGLRTSQVADHLATLLADIAGALIVVEESAGEPSALLADAVEIQRLVSERHGAQRARLGWTEAAMRREFMIVREEVGRVVRRALHLSGPLHSTDILATVDRFVDQAEYIGVRKLESTLSE